MNDVKKFKDPVYGYISVDSDLIVEIIDTHPGFQQLRDINQVIQILYNIIKLIRCGIPLRFADIRRAACNNGRHRIFPAYIPVVYRHIDVEVPLNLSLWVFCSQNDKKGRNDSCLKVHILFNTEGHFQ